MTSLRWAAADAWTIAGRDVAHWARQPAVLAFALAFPVLMLLMFGYLFGGGFRCRRAATTGNSCCPACSR